MFNRLQGILRGTLAFVAVLSSILQPAFPALQPDDVHNGDYDNVYLNTRNSSLCTRTCRVGEPPRICYYKWTLENHATLGRACGKCPSVREDCYRPQCATGDGFVRAILSINRKVPGPAIQVCKGDRVIVDVINEIKGSGATIHWHGIRQRRSPWMDGVYMVTQCPILDGQTFRYDFLVEDAGTFWYHSHAGLQKDDGILGGMVVRQPDAEEPLRKYYDYDLPSHLLVVQDWKHFTVCDILPGLLEREIFEDTTPTYYLINGRGIIPELNETLSEQVPVSVFKVKPGKRYRFRFVGATSLACLFRVSIEDHRLLLISGDRSPIQPITVDAIEIASGERYDVVVETNKPIDAYQIVVRGLRTCEGRSQIAYLQYDGSRLPTKTVTIQENNQGIIANPNLSPCTDASLSYEVCVSQLKSLTRTPPRIRGEPDVRVLIDFGFKFPTAQELYETNTYQQYFLPDKYLILIPLINNISYAFPPSPLLTQFRDIPKSKLCDSCPPREQFQGYCRCTNLIKLPTNALVEILMLSSTKNPLNRLTHPFHIHGYDFYIIEQGFTNNATLAEIERRLKHKRYIRDYLPMKDTVIIARDGFTVARIFTDNPGFWTFHCHFNFHLAFGMAAVFQVGELSEMLPPPRNFPRCNEFVPYVDDLYH